MKKIPPVVAKHLSDRGIIALADLEGWPKARPWPREYIGRVSEDTSWRHLDEVGFRCDRHDGLAFGPDGEPNFPRKSRSPVFALRRYNFAWPDGRHLSLWVGQCPDCGRIYWADRE